MVMHYIGFRNQASERKCFCTKYNYVACRTGLKGEKETKVKVLHF